jgi:hypothetical protein
MSEVRDQIQPLLSDYRQFHNHRDQIESADREYFEKQARVAVDTFQAMFRSRLRRNDYLLTSDEDEMLATMMSWAQDLRPSQINLNSTELSLEQCSELLAELSSDSASTNAPVAWPYIKKIE